MSNIPLILYLPLDCCFCILVDDIYYVIQDLEVNHGDFWLFTFNIINYGCQIPVDGVISQSRGLLSCIGMLY